MFIVSGDRGTGKTRTLIEKVKAEDGIIICEDAIRMRERSHNYGITGLNIASYADLYEGKVDSHGKHLYIDNINNFIKYSFPEVKGYTINLE